MTKSASDAIKERVFVDARLSQHRMVKEQATSASARFSKTPNQVQVRTETTSGFSVALDNPAVPTELLIEIDYKVEIKIPDKDTPVVSYESKHAVQFTIVGWGGFKDWTAVPTETFSAYFAVTHNIALTRAENTLAAMGLRSVALPRQINFDAPIAVTSEGIPKAPAATKA